MHAVAVVAATAFITQTGIASAAPYPFPQIDPTRYAKRLTICANVLEQQSDGKWTFTRNLL